MSGIINIGKVNTRVINVLNDRPQGVIKSEM